MKQKKPMKQIEKKQRIPKPADFVPVDDWPETHKWHGTNRVRCRAWLPNHGRQCMSQAVTSKGRKVCRTCGGMSPDGGPSHPKTVHGKFMQNLPTGVLRDVYQHSTENPDHSNDHEIAVLDARLSQLFGNLGDEGGSSLFRRMQTEMREFDKDNALANRLGDDEVGRRRALASAAGHLGNLRDLIKEANIEASVWDDIYKVMELRRKLTDSNRKVMIDARVLLRMDVVFLQLDQFVTEVITIVKDQDMIGDITNAYRNLPMIGGGDVS